MIEKIKALFEKMDCQVVVILQTPRAGEEVDNGYGIDFDLAEYAVIYDNVEKYYENSRMKYDFEIENKIDIMTFSKDGCDPSVEALCEELHDMDGYEVKWKQLSEKTLEMCDESMENFADGKVGPPIDLTGLEEDQKNE
jgi:hypothetical protein